MKPPYALKTARRATRTLPRLRTAVKIPESSCGSVWSGTTLRGAARSVGSDERDILCSVRGHANERPELRFSAIRFHVDPDPVELPKFRQWLFTYTYAMSRGSLPEETYAFISARLPDVRDVFAKAHSFRPDVLSVKFPPTSQAPEASVCFHDCAARLFEIRHALFEHAAHSEYYRRFRQPPDELVAISMERFYLDDAALRMYAAAECLASAVAAMLDVPKAALRAEKRKQRTSHHSALGQYLREHHSQHPLAVAMFDLHNLASWKFTMNYRNEWVHAQPPTIAGKGVVYHRGPRWQLDAAGTPVYLAITTGDVPKLTIEDVANNITAANESLVVAVHRALDAYEAQVTAFGYTRTVTGGMRFTMFE